MPKSIPLVLAILDGWGLGKPGPANAISLAHTPHMAQWMKRFPHSQLAAYGEAVGLSGTTTGNSEVGHLNIGAGYIVPQDEVRISRAFEDGSIQENAVLQQLFASLTTPKQVLHVVILAGPGRVHSNLDHLWGFLKAGQKAGVSKVVIHLISDGRDASPTWMGKNAEALQGKIEALGGQLASVCGRYWAMDRDKRWERTEKAYRLITERKGERAADLASAIKHSYAKDCSDEFIAPTIIGNGQPVKGDDVVVFLNFRSDRARQLTQAFVVKNFKSFPRTLLPKDVHFYTLTQYQQSLPVTGVLFAPQYVEMPLARVISEAGLRQLHAAESEKYAHVTYFLNGGREAPYAHEERLVVPSPKVATYDQQPAMSAAELTDKVVQRIAAKDTDVIMMNFANADMVAHTGNLESTIQAVEVVDACLGMIEAAVAEAGGVLVITADHGNAEQLRDSAGDTDTEHNSGVVPFMIVGKSLKGRLKNQGVLANVAPTILDLLDLEIPPAMEAGSLWERSA